MKKSLNIPVLNFETYLNDQLILDAEQCYDSGGIQSIELKKKDKWEISIKNINTYQVLIQVHEGKFLSANCDCKDKNENEICLHQVCGFFGIRHFENEKKEVKPKTLSRRKKASEHFKKLIDLVDSQQLKQFASSYAGKDKQFKLLLTVHFARHLDFMEKNTLYKDILDDCFPVKSENSSKNYLPESRMLQKIAKEIISNYIDALSLEDFTEAFHMISALQTKIAYALHILNKENKAITNLEDQVHKSYKALIDDRLAPALKHEIILTMIDSINLSFYKFQGEDNLYELVLKAKPTLEQNQYFQRILSEKINATKDFSDKAFLMSFLFKSIFSFEASDLDLVRNLNFDNFLIIECLDQMIDRGFIFEAEQALSYFKESYHLDEKIFFRFKLRFASLKNDDVEALEISMHLFKLDYDLKYLRFIKKHSGKNWAKIYREIKADLLSSGENYKFNLALSLAEKEGDSQTLIQLLIERNELEYFLRFDRNLVGKYNDDIYSFYRQYLILYLESHAGTKASEHVVSILNHLFTIGLKGISKKVSEELIAIYPHRRSLKAHLRSGKIEVIQKL